MDLWLENAAEDAVITMTAKAAAPPAAAALISLPGHGLQILFVDKEDAVKLARRILECAEGAAILCRSLEEL